MKNFVKNITSDILTWFIAIHALILLLFLVCLIPHEAVVGNIEKSVEAWDDGRLRPEVIEGVPQSTKDYLADARTFNIIWYQNDDPLEGVILSRFYFWSEGKESISRVIEDDPNPNNTYSRYWHGARVIYTPLLLVMTDTGIRYLLSGICLALFIYIIYLLYKKKQYYLGILFILSAAAIQAWWMSVSLEYLPALLIMLGSIVFLIKDKIKPIEIFCLSGTLIAFTDFFTIETITLTVPLLIYAYLNRSNIKISEMINACVAWCIGYAGTFCYKWLLVRVIYGGAEDTKAAIINHTEGQFIEYGIMKNLHMIFPFIKSANGVYTLMVIGAILLIILLFTTKKGVNWGYIIFAILMMAIPYIRFYILKEHAYTYYFFTYRAQMSLFMGMGCIVRENLIFQKVGTTCKAQKNSLKLGVKGLYR